MASCDHTHAKGAALKSLYGAPKHQHCNRSSFVACLLTCDKTIVGERQESPRYGKICKDVTKREEAGAKDAKMRRKNGRQEPEKSKMRRNLQFWLLPVFFSSHLVIPCFLLMFFDLVFDVFVACAYLCTEDSRLPSRHSTVSSA